MRSDDVIADRYRLVELIGSGGMGIVWLAVDLRDGREVALKRPHAGGSAIRADLEREADVARRVAHPNAVAVFEVVGEGNDCWLVMEYFPSTSLAATGTRTPEQVARIGAQVAGALAAAHAADVVHRDITPANVLVDDAGTAKVTDFGISAWRAATITSSGKISGTAAYVSPEVADGDGAKAPSDVFSLGATLFAAVEGAPPFGSGDPDVILTRIRAGRGEPSRHAGPLEPVLTALMRRDRADRPTAAQAKELLIKVADGEPVPTWTPAPTGKSGPKVVPIKVADGEPVRTWTPAPTRKKWAKVVLIAGVTAVVLVLAVLRPWETDDGPASTVLGDPRTADPCSVADAGALGRFGATRTDADYGGLNRCDVFIDVGSVADGGDEDIDVVFQFDGTAAGRTQVVRHEPIRDDGACNVEIVLADATVLEIDARFDEPRNDLCDVAGAAADHAENVLRANDVIPRRPALDPRSLANADACSLLQPADLATVAAFADAEPDAGFANWDCRWQDSDGDASVRVLFDRGDLANAKEGTRLDLSGHAAYLREEGYGADTCAARVFHREYRNDAGDELVEMALVIVEGDHPMADLCVLAGAFARPVAARLPAA